MLVKLTAGLSCDLSSEWLFKTRSVNAQDSCLLQIGNNSASPLPPFPHCRALGRRRQQTCC